MTIRITATESSRGRQLKIDGWLRAADLTELQRALVDHADRLALDLSELRGADEPAVTLLRELRLQGTQLLGTSAYVALRLEARSSQLTPGPTRPIAASEGDTHDPVGASASSHHQRGTR